MLRTAPTGRETPEEIIDDVNEGRQSKEEEGGERCVDDERVLVEKCSIGLRDVDGE